jgi:signal transduction histidine kinase
MTGLRGRLLLALVATSLATLAAAALVVLPPLEHRVVRDRLDEVRDIARTIRPALREVPVRDRRPGSPALDEIVSRLQARAGGRIVVYNAVGTELADTSATPEEAILGNPRELLAEVLRRPDGLLSEQHGNLAFAATAAGRPHTLLLVVSGRLDESRQAARVMRSAAPAALAAGVLVALLLGVIVSRGLLRRLDRLRGDAEALATEGLEHEVNIAGRDEVAVVARALEDMREALVDEQRTRQEFLATASHELRTPIASLQLSLELLEEESGPDRRTEAALRQTRRLSALATDLLDLSRVDAGVAVKLEPLDLGELAATVAGEFAARLDAESRPLHVHAGPALVQADPAAAARIVRILLDNAANYGEGAVSVSVTRAEHVTLCVEDEGPGLAEGERELVFRRFARGSAAAGAPSGAGLGLAIARGLARAMGGELDAHGARFSLVLPRA